jgi:hypothetical protein
MAHLRRALGWAVIGLGVSLLLPGCAGNPNETSKTAGTTAPDAPKSREEYYKSVAKNYEKASPGKATATTKPR